MLLLCLPLLLITGFGKFIRATSIDELPQRYHVLRKIKILALTRLRVIGVRGINAPGSATAEKFGGSAPPVAKNKT